MQIVLCIVSALFGGLSLVAAGSQIKSDKKSPAGWIMAAGSAVLIAAVICNIAGLKLDVAAAVLGCAAICAAAIMNGVKGKQLHIQHHIIRIALSVALAVGFALL